MVVGAAAVAVVVMVAGVVGAVDGIRTNVIQPKITAVMTAQRDAMGGGMFGGRGRRGGQGGQGGQAATPSAVQAASDDLKKTLDNKDSTPDDIKTKLQALRDAKKAAKDVLAKAQDDLKSVLTPRQEAVLVQRGMLD